MSWENEPNDDVRAVLKFWFEEVPEKTWYMNDQKLDQTITERFGPLHAQAAHGELFPWRATPAGRLAEIILLDQFSRNMFRDQPAAFQFDALALVLAQEALAAGADQKVPPRLRHFFYLPYMHSESPRIHAVAEKLYAQHDPDSLEWELKHKRIIDRFGRYPHRNKVLGRPSTPEEREFLKGPDSAF